MNTHAANTLIPTKFIAIGTQIVLSLVILYSQNNNLQEYTTPAEYDRQQTTLMGYLIAGCAILMIDLMVMFTGITLFKRQSLLFRNYH